jgi:hypothetical protein
MFCKSSHGKDRLARARIMMAWMTLYGASLSGPTGPWRRRQQVNRLNHAKYGTDCTGIMIGENYRQSSTSIMLTWTTRLVPMMRSRSQAGKSALTQSANLSGRLSPKKTISGLTSARHDSQRGMLSAKISFFNHSWEYSCNKNSREY